MICTNLLEKHNELTNVKNQYLCNKQEQIKCQVSPEWCSCGNCIEKKKTDYFCCKHPDYKLNIPDCITKTEKFKCLLHSSDEEMKGETPREKRERKYRKVAEMLFGNLGKGNRRPLPACAVWYIRNLHPSPTGNYCGFKIKKLS